MKNFIYVVQYVFQRFQVNIIMLIQESLPPSYIIKTLNFSLLFVVKYLYHLHYSDNLIVILK